MQARPGRIPVLVITGPVGVGKTSVAAEVSELLDQADIPHALLDVDSLRWCYPRPRRDPFRTELATKNLAVIWPNFQALGVDRLVLVDVIERRADLQRIRTAVPGAEPYVVRLRAAVETLTMRVQQRETGLGRERHLRRGTELAANMESAAIEDLLVETDGRRVPAIAREIAVRSGWLPAR